MSTYKTYQKIDRWIDGLCQSLIFSGIMALAAMVLIGCSTDSDRSRSVDLAVKGSYSPGDTAGTRIPIPQGGSDEKSRSAPTESAK
jgi:hypothetical protein